MSKSSKNVGKHNSRSTDWGNQQMIQEDGPQYRSMMIQSRAIPQPTRPISFSSPTKTHQTTSSSSAHHSSWTVDALPIPPGYFMERTNVHVNDSTAQECADRICEFLRTLNISAFPGNDDDLGAVEQSSSCNVLRAETYDCVKFAVRIFSDCGTIFVEVQRTAGCSFRFRETSLALLRSAKGLSQIPPNTHLAIPLALPQVSVEAQYASIQDDFEITLNLLKSERIDSQALALESLEQITKSCYAVDVAAKFVLGSNCLSVLMSLLEQETFDSSSSVSRKVLGILANALSALSTVDLAEHLSCCEYLKESSFLSVLLSTLKEASERPHDAYQAARCLSVLLVSNDVKNYVMDMSCVEVVETACFAGRKSHLALEQESQKLLSQLRC